MKSLFVDLFKYRTRENRTEKENWLTECLCAVLRALSSDQLCTFLDRLAEHEPGTFANALGTRRILISTQGAVNGGSRPDIVIRADDVPIAIFENKVGHKIGKRTKDDGSESPDQLIRYGKWLSANARSGDIKPLFVFLTHSTPAPTDFDDPKTDDKYGNVARRVIRWGPLAKILISNFNADPASLAGGLIEAFVGMLEKQNMITQYPDDEAIQAIEPFQKIENLVDNLVHDMWNAVSVYVNYRNSKSVQYYEEEFGTYWEWKYLKPTPRFMGEEMSLMTGIWFKRQSIGWGGDHSNSDEPGVPHAFICLSDDKDDTLRTIDGCPEGWTRVDKQDFLVCRPLADFDKDADRRAQQILHWVEEEGSKLRAFMLNAGLLSQL